MLTTRRACEHAGSLPGVMVYDHFGSDAFRAPGGTFATVWHATRTVNLRLTVEQQQRFVGLDGEGFSEIDNAWGRQGWTAANLEFVEEAVFVEALTAAWTNVKDRKPRPRRPTKKALRKIRARVERV